MKRATTQKVLSSLFLVFLASGVSAKTLDSFNYIDLISKRLISTCFLSETSLKDSYRCPSIDHLEMFIGGVLNDRERSKLINQTVRRLALIEHQKLILNAHRTNSSLNYQKVSVPPVSDLANEVLTRFNAPETILSAAIRGIIELNLERSTANSIVVSDQSIELVRHFSGANGVPLLTGAIETAQVAIALKKKRIQYKFILNQEEWTFDGQLKSWQSAESELIDTYILLQDQQGNAERRFI